KDDTYIYNIQQPSSSSPVEIMCLILSIWTIAPVWVWNMVTVIMVLESLLKTHRWTWTYDLAYSLSCSGRPEICAARIYKFEIQPCAILRVTMSGYMSIKSVIHALILEPRHVQVATALIYPARRS
ncbi:hypothetical protein BGZ92_005285, partial [Podila epicladia]